MTDLYRMAADEASQSVWSNPVFLNGVIIAALGVLVEILRRRFGKRDTAYDRLATQNATLQADNDWLREVNDWHEEVQRMLDGEVWERQRLMGAAGLPPVPRLVWPDRPVRRSAGAPAATKTAS